MKKRLLLLSIISCFLVSSFAQTQFPSLNLKDPNGKMVNLNNVLKKKG